MNAETKIEAEPAGVYAKIAAVQGALARHGIGKDRTNVTPGANYKFRGIDDVYNALAPLLAEHRLCILPRIVSHSLGERGKTSRGNPIFAAVVEAEFDFVSADDGSTHTIRTIGEAMDSSDKATNKAMSAAYKYAAFMAFAIPTEGDNDADATTHEIARSAASEPMPPAEYARLAQLVQATSSNIPKLMLAIGLSQDTPLDRIPASHFDAAVSALETKLARMALAETNARAKEAA